MDELNEEHPSRRFSQQELIDDLALCLQRMREVIGAEFSASLEGLSGVSRLRFSLMKLRIYNIRNIQHHAGQLSALLRRAGVETP